MCRLEVEPLELIELSERRSRALSEAQTLTHSSWSREGSLKVKPESAEAFLEFTKRLRESHFRRLALEWFMKVRLR